MTGYDLRLVCKHIDTTRMPEIQIENISRLSACPKRSFFAVSANQNWDMRALR